MYIVAWSVALVVLYNAGAWAGLQIGTFGTAATLVWPPAGIALAFCIALRWSMVPAVWVGAFLANAGWFYNQGFEGSLLTASIIATNNTAEAIVIMWFSAHYREIEGFWFESPQAYVRHMAIRVGATMLAAYGGASAVIITSAEVPEMFLPMFISWWAGDLASVLVIGPIAFHCIRWIQGQTTAWERYLHS
jgi:integral membrane sensor domain MASE1